MGSLGFWIVKKDKEDQNFYNDNSLDNNVQKSVCSTSMCNYTKMHISGNSSKISVKESKVNHVSSLHSVLWYLSDGSGCKRNVLETGLKISSENIHTLEAINIFFPFYFSEHDIVDLCNKFKDRNVVTEVFNRSNWKPRHSNNIIEIFDDKNNSSQAHLAIYKLDKENYTLKDVKDVENDLCGTILRINIPDVLSYIAKNLRKSEAIDNIQDLTEFIYFRFKIDISLKAQCLTKAVSQSGRALLSHFEQDHVVDFKVNYKRDLPEVVDRYANAKLSHWLNFTTIDFILITSESMKLLRPSDQETRLIKSKHWGEYLGFGTDYENKFENLVVHQWSKEKSNRKYFSSYAPLSQGTTSKYGNTPIYGCSFK